MKEMLILLITFFALVACVQESQNSVKRINMLGGYNTLEQVR